jgi:hypothetical protein
LDAQTNQSVISTLPKFFPDKRIPRGSMFRVG